MQYICDGDVLGGIYVFSRKFIFVMALTALPFGAYAQKHTPPSPYGDDKQGVYDYVSGCWAWDHGSTGKIIGSGYQFITDSRCDGKALEGKAIIRWRGDRRDGETWDGSFSNGKFTGRATVHHIYGDIEYAYVDGMRNGPARLVAPGGAHQEMNFKDDLADGPFAKIYADGSREDFVCQKGQQVGLSVTTFRDGSKMEEPLEDHFGQKPRIFITASGEQLKGDYRPPHVDMARHPAFPVPMGMIGIGGWATVTISLAVAEDGSVHDPRLAQSSGYLLVDQTLLRQIPIWHFFPATLDGKPMASMAIFEENIKLD